MEDKTLAMTMLLDFYGELLTEKQRSCFDMYYNEDLSLSEIAELQGVSRQGVRDLLVRTESSLRETEEKLGVVAKYIQRREILAELEETLDALIGETNGRSRELVERALQRLRDLES